MREIELCWNITANCNQNCKYCHRFLNINNLSYSNNLSILNNLIKSGIKKITWTGGEALLLDYLDSLIKKSYKSGIKNKLITNGMLLTRERLEKVAPFLDQVTLSIDSINSEINEYIGRGEKHFTRIQNCIKDIKRYNKIISINSVLSKVNKNDFTSLANFISECKIEEWRIFKFMPLRETSIQNKNLFDISNIEYSKIIGNIRKSFPNLNIVTRELIDLEKLYLLILANGDIYITQEGKDIKLGNAMRNNISEIITNLEILNN